MVRIQYIRPAGTMTEGMIALATVPTAVFQISKGNAILVGGPEAQVNAVKAATAEQRAARETALADTPPEPAAAPVEATPTPEAAPAAKKPAAKSTAKKPTSRKRTSTRKTPAKK